jgi:hypothetical protein
MSRFQCYELQDVDSKSTRLKIKALNLCAFDLETLSQSIDSEASNLKTKALNLQI